MLSAFVLVEPSARRFEDADRARAIVKTLGALVDLVVADIVADATILTRPDRSIAGLEGSSGCRVVEDADVGQALVRALPHARRDDALILTPGFAPGFPFRAEIELALRGPDTPALRLRAEPEGFLSRLFPAAAPVVGLVASRAALHRHAARNGGGMIALCRALGATPMRSRATRV